MSAEFSIEALFKNLPSSGWHQDGAILIIYKDGMAILKVPLSDVGQGFPLPAGCSISISNAVSPVSFEI